MFFPAPPSSHFPIFSERPTLRPTPALRKYDLFHNMTPHGASFLIRKQQSEWHVWSTGAEANFFLCRKREIFRGEEAADCTRSCFRCSETMREPDSALVAEVRDCLKHLHHSLPQDRVEGAPRGVPVRFNTHETNKHTQTFTHIYIYIYIFMHQFHIIKNVCTVKRTSDICEYTLNYMERMELAIHKHAHT